MLQQIHFRALAIKKKDDLLKKVIDSLDLMEDVPDPIFDFLMLVVDEMDQEKITLEKELAVADHLNATHPMPMAIQ
jgi:hypothetical protein